MFLPYLWGMETCSKYEFHKWDTSSYRTYEEWKQVQILIISRCTFLVLTVPMRNGNIWNWTANTPKNQSVLTVPMRNGNELFSSPLSPPFFWFLPYLWGMETTVFWSTSKVEKVLTVPMRNGNCSCSRRWQSAEFQFLPYLWGMETSIFIWNHPLLRKFLPYLWGMETSEVKAWTS